MRSIAALASLLVAHFVLAGAPAHARRVAPPAGQAGRAAVAPPASKGALPAALAVPASAPSAAGEAASASAAQQLPPTVGPKAPAPAPDPEDDWLAEAHVQPAQVQRGRVGLALLILCVAALAVAGGAAWQRRRG